PQESPVPEETTQASEPESEAQEEQLSEEQEPAPAETIDQDIAQTQRIAMNERALAQEDNAEHNKNDFMDLPSSESFTLALEEIKRNFQAEIDALKEEIRQLKNNR
ncbi:MAG TPA: hypothetical protein PKN70_08575, partial [Smithellaceae bacterium]|nr:hypothetical protein [Smithellaceae bacterium]HQM44504.1 hypothetical protein [Smithellaceae bacterium]